MHAGDTSVDIILATYNGASFLQAQLQSILDQTDSDWRLIIRDDGSEDETPAIIRRFACEHPDKVVVLEDGCTNLGVVANFSTLMAASTANYVMFCDQDDVWLPDKIAKSRRAIQALEIRHGRDRPLLVHCDLKVVDSDLQEIAPSFLNYRRIDPIKGADLRNLLVQNVVTGCAAMINRSLRDLALPVPTSAMMHDWWTAIVAGALGEIGYIEEPLILYRQHGRNSVGARSLDLMWICRRAVSGPSSSWRRAKFLFRQTLSQAEDLLLLHEGRMRPEIHQVVSQYAAIDQCRFFGRRLSALRFGFRPNKWIDRAVFLAVI